MNVSIGKALSHAAASFLVVVLSTIVWSDASTPQAQGPRDRDTRARESKPSVPKDVVSRPLEDVVPEELKADIRGLRRATPSIEQWTHTWTNVGCDVGWGQTCEGEVLL